MDHLEKDIKQRFENQMLPMEEEAAAFLWDNIESELEDDQGKRRVLWFFLFGLLIAGASISSFYIPFNKHVEQRGGADPVEKPLEMDNAHYPEKQAVVSEQAIYDVKDRLESPTNLKVEVPFRSNLMPIQSDPTEIAVRKNAPFEKLGESVSIWKPVHIGFLATPLYGLIAYEETIEIQSRINELSVKDVHIPGKSKSPIRFDVGIHGGASIAHTNYRSETMPTIANLKNTTEQGQWGNHFGLHVSAFVHDNIILSSGVERTIQWTRFDFEESKIIQVLKEDQLWRVEIDADTKDTIQTFFKDTLIDADYSREVRHHNQATIWSVPLMAGYQHHIDQWRFGLEVGVLFQFVGPQSGKSIHPDATIRTYDSLSSIDQLPLPSFAVGARIRPFIAYDFNNRWSISLAGQINTQQLNSYNLADLKLSWTQYQITTGVHYRF